MIIKFDYVNGKFENTIIGVGENQNKFKFNGGYIEYNLVSNMVKIYKHQNYATVIYNKEFSENEYSSYSSIIIRHKKEVLKYILRKEKINRLLK